MIRVLIVDDSETARQIMTEALSGEDDIRIVGYARDGAESVSLAEKLTPEVVIMDILMPGMSGLDAIREIMKRAPARILVMSNAAETRTDRVGSDAIQAGALGIMLKPRAGPDFAAMKRDILSRIRLVSQVAIPRASGRGQRNGTRAQSEPQAAPAYKVRLIAIGSSAGGPGALREIFSRLPARFHVPVIVAQHQASGFMSGMAEWLAGSSPNPVRVAEDGETMRSGTIYISPDSVHTGVTIDGKIQLQAGPEIDGARPSINHLFTKVAESYGPMALALLLTGMGSDGVRGLSRVKAMGGRVFVQDQSTSLVFGMPSQAIREGIVDRVLKLDEIPEALIKALM